MMTVKNPLHPVKDYASKFDFLPIFLKKINIKEVIEKQSNLDYTYDEYLEVFSKLLSVSEVEDHEEFAEEITEINCRDIFLYSPTNGRLYTFNKPENIDPKMERHAGSGDYYLYAMTSKKPIAVKSEEISLFHIRMRFKEHEFKSGEMLDGVSCDRINEILTEFKKTLLYTFFKNGIRAFYINKIKEYYDIKLYQSGYDMILF